MTRMRPSSYDVELLPSEAAVSDTIIVKVGVERRTYTLHSEILKHHSGYFRGALSGSFKETANGIVPLFDVDTDAFDVFVDWCYRCTLKDTLEHIRFNPDKGVATAFRAYILADRLLVPGLKAALIDCYFVKEIFDLKEWYPNCRRIIHAFKHLSEDDPLIRLYVDLWVSRNVFQKLDTYDQVIKARLPYAFLVRLLRRADEVGQNPQSMLPLKRKDYTEVAPIP